MVKGELQYFYGHQLIFNKILFTWFCFHTHGLICIVKNLQMYLILRYETLL